MNEREIEFRGLTKDGKLIEGCHCIIGAGIHCILAKHIPIHIDSRGQYIERTDFVEVLPETVGQYTGLKDKNGVNLAAGDKYKWLGWEVRDGKQIRPERIETIRNDTPEHWIEDCHRLWCISTGNSQGTVEVIGNIHEEAKP